MWQFEVGKVHDDIIRKVTILLVVWTYCACLVHNFIDGTNGAVVKAYLW